MPYIPPLCHNLSSTEPYWDWPDLENIISLAQANLDRRLGGADDAVGLDGVALGVDLHGGHDGVELHVLLADGAAVLDGFDAFAQVVGFDGPGGDRGGRDECDGGGRDEGREHGS